MESEENKSIWLVIIDGKAYLPTGEIEKNDLEFNFTPPDDENSNLRINHDPS